jgi:bifunctional DNA-binding transcriptional regulator/antitoxin component of YhaV-PrlF toxin-antitoxin module
MMSMAKVQARDQVTIPQEIRELCGIEPGAELVFVATGPRAFECRVLPPHRSLMDVVDRFTVEGVAPDLGNPRDAMGAAMVQERLTKVHPAAEAAR